MKDEWCYFDAILFGDQVKNYRVVYFLLDISKAHIGRQG